MVDDSGKATESFQDQESVENRAVNDNESFRDEESDGNRAANRLVLLNHCVVQLMQMMIESVAGNSVQSGLNPTIEQFEELCLELEDYNSFMHGKFSEFCGVMEKCLLHVEDKMSCGTPTGEMYDLVRPFVRVLKAFKDMVDISNSTYREEFAKMLRKRCFAIQIIFVKDRGCIGFIDDKYKWLPSYKELLSFDSKLILINSMFYKDELNQMVPTIVIDRTDLLEESIKKFGANYVPRKILNIRFKNEVAGGFGIAREWVFLVSKELFSEQLGLFKACGPNRRLRPIPVAPGPSKDSKLKYFRFAGQILSLALKYKIQLGVLFDQVFFLILEGRAFKGSFEGAGPIQLEDIVETDEELYNSYKQLLKMNSEEIAGLGLKFVGQIYGIPLCEGGSDMDVTVENKELFVELSINQRFVEDVCEVADQFGRGFSSLFSEVHHRMSIVGCMIFFGCLTLGDLDRLVGGGDTTLSVEDWKKYTVYQGYSEMDAQICWFWELVDIMPVEKRRNLLFFWTSMKYLPGEGFVGLDKPLKLVKSSLESSETLPTAKTCFPMLFLPPYPSKEDMEKCLNIITGEFAVGGFGLN